MSPRLAALVTAGLAFVLTGCPDDEDDLTSPPDEEVAEDPSPEAFCNVATTDVGTFDFVGEGGFTDGLAAMRRVAPVTLAEIRGDVDTIIEKFETVETALPPDQPTMDVQSALQAADALTQVDQDELDDAIGNVVAYIQDNCLDDLPDADASAPGTPGAPTHQADPDAEGPGGAVEGGDGDLDY
jgi:hypothetical protein